MNRKHRLPNETWLALVVWGSLWGFFEATLGSLLHWIPLPGAAGTLLFPLGFFCMMQAVLRSGKPAAAWNAALLAAAFKAACLLWPGVSPLAVLRPTAAILLEAVIVTVVLFRVDGHWMRPAFGTAAAVSLAWRSLYVGIAAGTRGGGLFQRGGNADLSFILGEGLLEAVLLFLAWRAVGIHGPGPDFPPVLGNPAPWCPRSSPWSPAGSPYSSGGCHDAFRDLGGENI